MKLHVKVCLRVAQRAFDLNSMRHELLRDIAQCRHSGMAAAHVSCLPQHLLQPAAYTVPEEVQS